ncbi:hypothetical protein PGO33_14015 [Klebsiella aerogenes]|uniref:hypothetical protein n=1 Tax=Klebsiella aerogenes TaxID=548 RepID=UPI000F7F18B1|nr:hypothetical protein [Klebsiella aerogenes]RSV94057.1 hypothetical protein EGH55_09645 [Klebsiella aerogenes]
MTSNSDFFDVSELFNIPEQFDIPDAFYRIDDFSKKFNVRQEDIISTWLDNKISLYVNLRSEYCRIIRYANKKEHRYDTFDIRAGGDFYQHESSSQFAVRTFIPCDQSEINEYPVFSGSSFFKYIYNGYASGFWRLQPTSTTHLATDNYNLKNANELWNETPGEVRVFGRDDRDCLIFDKNIFVSHECLYIDNSGYQELSQQFKIEENKTHEVESCYIQTFIALILLKINFAKENGKINCLKTINILNAVRDDHKISSIKDISNKTISKWVKDSLIEESKLSLETEDGRHSKIKDNVIYLTIKHGHANLTPGDLANLLLKEGRSYQLQQDITFSVLETYLDALFIKYA